jgi:hypothetical protein
MAPMECGSKDAALHGQNIKDKDCIYAADIEYKIRGQSADCFVVQALGQQVEGAIKSSYSQGDVNCAFFIALYIR